MWINCQYKICREKESRTYIHLICKWEYTMCHICVYGATHSRSHYFYEKIWQKRAPEKRVARTNCKPIQTADIKLLENYWWQLLFPTTTTTPLTFSYYTDVSFGVWTMRLMFKIFQVSFFCSSFLRIIRASAYHIWSRILIMGTATIFMAPLEKSQVSMGTV